MPVKIIEEICLRLILFCGMSIGYEDTTLSTPDGSYVLKFDNPQNGGRWKPNYFTKLLIPADLRNKMFVSRQPA